MLSQSVTNFKSAHADVQEGDIHIHVSPLKLYFLIYAALLVLTGVTVLVSYADLGGVLAIGVAMFVAFIKAALVVTVFMHLLWDDKFNTFAFLASLFFIALFFLITMSDVVMRGTIIPEQDNWSLIKDKEAADKQAGSVK